MVMDHDYNRSGVVCREAMLTLICLYASYRNIQLAPMVIPDMNRKKMCLLFLQKLNFSPLIIKVAIRKRLPIRVLRSTIS